MNNKTFLIAAVIIIAVIVIYKFFLSAPKSTEADLKPDNFEEMTKGSDVVLLDVRSAFEFGGDKIAGAQNVSYSASDFKPNIEKLDKDKIYLVYCATGSRSAGACKVMKEMGFKKIYNLKGGIEHWKSEGKPIVR